jgi:formylmethanofuran dehydrogenase subunit E
MPHEPDIYDDPHLYCDVCHEEIADREQYYVDIEGMTLCQTCFDDWVWEHTRSD